MLDFILIEQDLPSIVGLKSCLDLGLIKRIYHLQEQNLESKYADVFEGLGEIKGVQHKNQIDPDATFVVHPNPPPPPVGFLWLFATLLKRSFREWRSWESLRNVQSPLSGYTVLWLPRRRITSSECAWILATSIVPSFVNIFPCRLWKR